MALTTKRIIALPSQNDPQEGDYLAIDNATSGTKKIPVGRVGVEVDDTLTEAGKAADAKAVGDALDEIRSQVEVTGTASGATATFTDGAAMPAKSVIVNIEPQQSGTGTPSPDNVRQISGWESVTVADCAVNMVTEQTNEKRPCFIKAGTSIVASVKKDGDGNAYFYYYRADGSQIDYWSLSSTQDGRSFRNITVQEDVYFVAWLAVTGTTITDRQVAVSPRLEYGETLAHNKTVNLGRTVYGGTLDVVSGVLTVDKGFVTVGNLTKAGSLQTGTYTCCQRYDLSPVANTVGISQKHGAISNMGVEDNAYYGSLRPNESGSSDVDFAIGTVGSILTVYDTDLTLTDTTFADKYGSMQIVYPLAEPQTYQLTPTEIQTLLGENNVWADSGDVEVVYVRDLNIVINNLIGA